MNSFEDFVRYGLPGYILIISICICLFIVGKLPTSNEFYKNYGTIIGTILLVIGPLIGFLIHQIYFLYFDWQESYTKVSRKCIAFITQAYLSSDQYTKTLLDKNAIEGLASQSWIMLTTNFEESLKVNDLYLTRLRSLRNYSHAFGAIIISSALCISIGEVILLLADKVIIMFVTPFFLTHFLLSSLFLYKRADIMKIIDDFEIGIALSWKDYFISHIYKLYCLKQQNLDIFRLIGMENK